MTGFFFKTREIKELMLPVKQKNRKAGGAATQKTCDDTHRKSRGAQCCTVNDQLGIQKDRGHHKSRQPVFPQALLSKRRCDRNRPVHAERRSNAKETGRNDADKAPLLILHTGEYAVDLILCKNRNERPEQYAEDPVPENLPELDLEIVPDINKLSSEDRIKLSHRCSPARRCDCQGRSPLRAPGYEQHLETPSA